MRRCNLCLEPRNRAPRLGALNENRRHVRRDRDVVLDHGDVVSHAEDEAGRLGMLCNEAGNQRVIAHEPRKARMRVVTQRHAGVKPAQLQAKPQHWYTGPLARK